MPAIDVAKGMDPTEYGPFHSGFENGSRGLVGLGGLLSGASLIGLGGAAVGAKDAAKGKRLRGAASGFSGIYASPFKNSRVVRDWYKKTTNQLHDPFMLSAIRNSGELAAKGLPQEAVNAMSIKQLRSKLIGIAKKEKLKMMLRGVGLPAAAVIGPAVLGANLAMGRYDEGKRAKQIVTNR